MVQLNALQHQMVRGMNWCSGYALGDGGVVVVVVQSISGRSQTRKGRLPLDLRLLARDITRNVVTFNSQVTGQKSN